MRGRNTPAVVTYTRRPGSIVALGPRSLKGLGEGVELFDVRRPGTTAMKVVDPVCGMELDANSIEATLTYADIGPPAREVL